MSEKKEIIITLAKWGVTNTNSIKEVVMPNKPTFLCTKRIMSIIEWWLKKRYEFK
ncbi:hypothetical protein [Mycoplasma todarodis]|uniref:hypothetical protein n=1 Tax=Mycoplasma todarodis TaxID=1937191 RepID=UPI0014445F59|nr:hypothetical protein [Mycoplasma todarodis]